MKKTIITLLILLNITLNAEDMEMIDTKGISYQVNANNQQFEIEGMRGKVVFLEFFGLQCPACKEIMPNLINLQNKYPYKLQVMAIEVQSNDIKPINQYRKRYGINYTTFSNYDVGRVVRYIADNANWHGEIPFLVAIDAYGKVRALKTGIIPEQTLENYIKLYSK